MIEFVVVAVDVTGTANDLISWSVVVNCLVIIVDFIVGLFVDVDAVNVGVAAVVGKIVVFVVGAVGIVNGKVVWLVGGEED